MDSNYVKSVTLEEINLSNGVVKVRIQIEDPYYYQVMSEMTGVTIESEYQLIHTLKELAQMKQEYTKSPAGHRIRTWNRLWCGDPREK